jgi:hypothetical protein
MATRQMIVAICFTAAVCFTEARSAIQEKARDPDTDLTTVRLFYFIPHDKLRRIVNKEVTNGYKT